MSPSDCAAPARSSRAPVLVVDDDEDIRDTIALVLGDEGYGVVTASDGVGALEQLEKHVRPCLILLDLIMPRMDGLMFLEKLRADPRFAHTPVAILSAGSILRLPPGTLVLPKPVPMERLLAVIEAHCGKSPPG